MHGRCGEKAPKNTRPEHSEKYLDDPGHHAHAESEAIRLHIRGRVPARGKAEVRDAADRDDDEAGRGPLDRELRVTQESGENAPDNRREDSGYGRISAGEGDAKTKRERDQEDEKAGKQIGGPVFSESVECAYRHLFRRRVHIHSGLTLHFSPTAGRSTG